MKVQGSGMALAQAKVTRADGTVEYRYSLPDTPWWHLRARLRRRLLIAWARLNLED